MSILSDRDIRLYCGTDREIFLGAEAPPLISPYYEDFLQPASYDVRLSNSFMSINENYLSPVDLGDSRTFEDLYVHHEITNGYYKLPAKGFVLARTEETINVPSDLVGILHGKSTRARLGLVIENAGFVDPGFSGQLTMEIYNQLPIPIYLRPGQTIAQVSFQTLTGSPDNIYGDTVLGSHYQNSVGVVGPR